MAKIEELFKKYPWLIAVAVFVVGLFLLWIFGFFSSSSSAASSRSSGDPNLAAAYYAAETAQSQSSAAIQINQDTQNAQTAQTGLLTASQVAIANSNNDAAVATSASSDAAATQQAWIAEQGQVLTATNTAYWNAQQANVVSQNAGLAETQIAVTNANAATTQAWLAEQEAVLTAQHANNFGS